MLFGFDLTQFIEVLGYPGIFAIVLAESGLFFGVSLPGGSMLFTAGLLASQGFLNIWILLVVVIVAAIIGDSIGYWFGSWVGPALWNRADSRFFKKRYLEQTRDFFDTYGSSTILLGRFIPVVRTFAPILAGVANMHYRTFLIYNALGAVMWGAGFVLAGYILGETVPNIEDYLEYMVIGIVLATLVPFLLHLRKPGRTHATTRPQALIFDLDNTLADSFTPPTTEILNKLRLLSREVPVAVMSGAAHTRVKHDVMERLLPFGDSKFYMFTDSASRCYVWDGSWQELYSHHMSPEECQHIRSNIMKSIAESGIYNGSAMTAQVLARDTSVAFHALQKEATQLEKREWDSTGEKRQKLARVIRRHLPDYEVMIGGKTTIDVTKNGINKAHGVEWLAKTLGLAPSDMLFVGDAFYTGGNDAIVVPTGIKILETSGPKETDNIIDDLIRKYRS